MHNMTGRFALFATCNCASENIDFDVFDPKQHDLYLGLPKSIE